MPTSHDVIRDIFYADFPLNPMLDSRNVDLGELRPRRVGDKQLCGDGARARAPPHRPKGCRNPSADAGTRAAFAILSLRLQVGFANPIGQAAKLPSKTNSTDRFFKLRRVATTGVGALPALGGRRRSRPRRAPEKHRTTGDFPTAANSLLVLPKSLIR